MPELSHEPRRIIQKDIFEDALGKAKTSHVVGVNASRLCRVGADRVIKSGSRCSYWKKHRLVIVSERGLNNPVAVRINAVGCHVPSDPIAILRYRLDGNKFRWQRVEYLERLPRTD